MSLLHMSQHQAEMQLTGGDINPLTQRNIIDDIRTGVELALKLKEDIDKLHPYVAQVISKLFSF